MRTCKMMFVVAACIPAVVLVACGQNGERPAPPPPGDGAKLERRPDAPERLTASNECENGRGLQDGPNQILQQKLMQEEKPEWLEIGPPRKVVIAELPNQNAGPATSATIPNTVRGSENIIIDDVLVKMPRDFKANGISNETKNGMVVLRRNTEARIYQIKDGGLVLVPDISLPRFNYGEPKRWFLSNWQWLDSENLVVISNEENPETDMISDSRIYTYNLRTKTLQRVILPEALTLEGEIKFISARDKLLTVKNRSEVILLRFL